MGRNYERFSHPGEALQAWRNERRSGLCFDCPSKIILTCRRSEEMKSRCFQAWLMLDKDAFMSDRAKNLKSMAEKYREEWYKKYPHLLVDCDLSNPEAFTSKSSTESIWSLLELDVRSANVLSVHKVETVADLMKLTRDEVAVWRNCGKITTNIICETQASIASLIEKHSAKKE